MPTINPKQLYAEDEVLAKLETALAESSGELKSDIRAAVQERKKELRDRATTRGVSSDDP